MKLRLTIEVTLNDELSPDAGQSLEVLTRAAEHLADNGMLSSEYDICDEVTHLVEVI